MSSGGGAAARTADSTKDGDPITNLITPEIFSRACSSLQIKHATAMRNTGPRQPTDLKRGEYVQPNDVPDETHLDETSPFFAVGTVKASPAQVSPPKVWTKHTIEGALTHLLAATPDADMVDVLKKHPQHYIPVKNTVAFPAHYAAFLAAVTDADVDLHLQKPADLDPLPTMVGFSCSDWADALTVITNPRYHLQLTKAQEMASPEEGRKGTGVCSFDVLRSAQDAAEYERVYFVATVLGPGGEALLIVVRPSNDKADVNNRANGKAQKRCEGALDQAFASTNMTVVRNSVIAVQSLTDRGTSHVKAYRKVDSSGQFDYVFEYTEEVPDKQPVSSSASIATIDAPTATPFATVEQLIALHDVLNALVVYGKNGKKKATRRKISDSTKTPEYAEIVEHWQAFCGCFLNDGASDTLGVGLQTFDMPLYLAKLVCPMKFEEPARVAPTAFSIAFEQVEGPDFEVLEISMGILAEANKEPKVRCFNGATTLVALLFRTYYAGCGHYQRLSAAVLHDTVWNKATADFTEEEVMLFHATDVVKPLRTVAVEDDADRNSGPVSLALSALAILPGSKYCRTGTSNRGNEVFEQYFAALQLPDAEKTSMHNCLYMAMSPMPTDLPAQAGIMTKFALALMGVAIAASMDVAAPADELQVHSKRILCSKTIALKIGATFWKMFVTTYAEVRMIATALMHLDFVNGIIEINSGMGKASDTDTDLFLINCIAAVFDGMQRCKATDLSTLLKDTIVARNHQVARLVNPTLPWARKLRHRLAMIRTPNGTAVEPHDLGYYCALVWYVNWMAAFVALDRTDYGIEADSASAVQYTQLSYELVFGGDEKGYYETFISASRKCKDAVITFNKTSGLLQPKYASALLACMLLVKMAYELMIMKRDAFTLDTVAPPPPPPPVGAGAGSDEGNEGMFAMIDDALSKSAFTPVGGGAASRRSPVDDLHDAVLANGVNAEALEAIPKKRQGSGEGDSAGKRSRF